MFYKPRVLDYCYAHKIGGPSYHRLLYAIVIDSLSRPIRCMVCALLMRSFSLSSFLRSHPLGRGLRDQPRGEERNRGMVREGRDQGKGGEGRPQKKGGQRTKDAGRKWALCHSFFLSFFLSLADRAGGHPQPEPGPSGAERQQQHHPQQAVQGESARRDFARRHITCVRTHTSCPSSRNYDTFASMILPPSSSTGRCVCVLRTCTVRMCVADPPFPVY